MMIQMRERANLPAESARRAGEMPCEEFQAQIPELIGGNIHEHEHLASCERCTALIEELEYIGEIAKGLLPAYEPPDSLWGKIADSLQGDEPDGPANRNGESPAGKK